MPDVFVVKDCEPGNRRIFQTWEELTVPHAVFEVTSRRTWLTDRNKKPRIYARLGIPAYFLFDPTGDYLKPPLCGYRLQEGQYVPIEPDDTGALLCEQLGVTLRLEGGGLRFYDTHSGQPLRTPFEAEHAARLVAEAARETAELAHEKETAAREAAEAGREAAEAEIQRLRALLEKRRD